MELKEFNLPGQVGDLHGWQNNAHSELAPVLFIHPINLQGLVWKQVVQLLNGERHCIMPDLRGHGKSDPSGPYGLDEWLSDCSDVLDGLGVNRPVHVVGGSLGGSLACCFASRYPERTLSITAVGSSLNFQGVDVEGVIEMFARLGVEGTFRAVFPTLTFGPDVIAEVIELGISLANPNRVEVVQQVWRATIDSDSTEEAKSVSCPSLLITGEHDATCTPRLGLEMARILQTEQVILPGIGHLPMLECPEHLAVLLDRHFRNVEPGDGA